MAAAHPAPTATTDTLSAVAAVLGEALQLSAETIAGLGADTPLFGHLPELDSMAVATVLTALEDRFHILIDDEEVSGDLFQTLGALADFVALKLESAGRR